MRPFYENLPFLTIFLPLLCGVASAAIRDGKKAYRLTLISAAAVAVLSAALLYFVYTQDVSFT